MALLRGPAGTRLAGSADGDGEVGFADLADGAFVLCAPVEDGGEHLARDELAMVFDGTGDRFVRRMPAHDDAVADIEVQIAPNLLNLRHDLAGDALRLEFVAQFHVECDRQRVL